MELEEKMSRELAHQRAQQAALIKDKLAQRKKERMRKLKEQQELQKAKVTFTICTLHLRKIHISEQWIR